MKQKIYLSGLITIAIIITGSLLKVNHFPGGAHLLILGIAMLVFFFLPAALFNNYRTEGNRKNPALYIVTWLTCLVVFGGMLYKIMHWPGAGIALMVSLPFPYVVFLPVFLSVAAKDKSFNINDTVAVLFLLVGVSVFSTLLALNVSRERIADSMGLSVSYNRLEAVLDDIPVPGTVNPAVKDIDDLLRIVNDYQGKIFAVEGLTEQQWNEDPMCFPKPEWNDIAGHALLVEGDKPAPDTGLGEELDRWIGSPGKSNLNPELAAAAPAVVDYQNDPEGPLGWTKEKFGISPRVWSLIYLDGLETDMKVLRTTLR
jgi:hypothetical protein